MRRLVPVTRFPSSAVLTGRVAALWRYPVKSFRGESFARAHLDKDGFVGDRAWGFRDLTTGLVLSARRHAALLQGEAWLDDDRTLASFPGCEAVEPFDPRLAAAVSDAIGSEVEVIRAAEFDEALEMQGTKGPFRGRAGSLVDSAVVHLVTTSGLAALSATNPGSAFDVRRFRPNIIVDTDADGPVERDWIGSDLTVGDAVLRIERSCGRCAVTTQAQSDLPHDPEVLRTVAQRFDNVVGVYASVVRSGAVSAGGSRPI